MLIKNGRIIDPYNNRDEINDLLIEDGLIKSIGKIDDYNGEVIDAKGLVVAPGFIDNHVHFRDPGFLHKETIETGCNAAMAGGFTTVVAMANTNPVVDNVEVYKELSDREKKLPINVYNTCAVTKNLKGKEIVDMEALKNEGTIGFTDDGVPISDEVLLMEAFKRAKALNLPISLHEEDPNIVGSFGVNAGEVATKIGVEGAPSLAEELLVARDCLLAKETGARIDIQHLSSGVSVDIIRFMKSLGVDVWCEVTPQHFTLTEDEVLKQGAQAKVNPPLRKEEDRLKLIEGLKDGTIDMIVTDHAPHSEDEKALGILNGAPSGMIGLETSLALGITSLVEKGHLSLNSLLEKMTINPAKYYNLDAGTLSIGKNADITIFDPNEKWNVSKDDFYGKSVNSPFIGFNVKGRVKYTICSGNIVFKHK